MGRWSGREHWNNWYVVHDYTQGNCTNFPFVRYVEEVAYERRFSLMLTNVRLTDFPQRLPIWICGGLATTFAKSCRLLTMNIGHAIWNSRLESNSTLPENFSWSWAGKLLKLSLFRCCAVVWFTWRCLIVGWGMILFLLFTYRRHPFFFL